MKAHNLSGIVLLLASLAQVHAKACRRKQSVLQYNVAQSSLQLDSTSDTSLTISLHVAQADGGSDSTAAVASAQTSDDNDVNTNTAVQIPTIQPTDSVPQTVAATDSSSETSSPALPAATTASAAPSPTATGDSIPASTAATVAATASVEASGIGSDGYVPNPAWANFGPGVKSGYNISSYTSGTVQVQATNGQTTAYSTYLRTFDYSFDVGVLGTPDNHDKLEWPLGVSFIGSQSDTGSCEYGSTASGPPGIAISTAVMSSTFNTSHSVFCGAGVTITINGSDHKAIVIDSCAACSPVPFGHVDGSKKLWQSWGIEPHDDIGYQWGTWKFDDDYFGKMWQTFGARAEKIPMGDWIQEPRKGPWLKGTKFIGK